MHPYSCRRCLAVLLATVLPAKCIEFDRQLDAQEIQSARTPNVLLMMADDLAYADLSCYGSQLIRTPRLDQLAGEGVRLTSFYAGCTVCTPSRMSLLTGYYARRVGWQGGVIGHRIDPQRGLHPDVRTIGDVFQDAGYATAMIGKWHLGDGEELSPMAQGFDSAFYIDKSNNQSDKLWRGNQLVRDPFDNRLLTEQFVAEATKWIDANHQRPFFLYLPFTAPHFPAQAHPDWKGKSKNAAYGDVVEELDFRIGQLLDTLDRLEIADQTIVVFLSDNGVENGQRKWARATPFRGRKWSVLEGGNRVPCIIRWPRQIPAGSVSDELVSALDLLPTLADACDIEIEPADSAGTVDIPPLDGMNVLGMLQNQSRSPRTSLLYFQGWGKLEAIRMGDWKLVLEPNDQVASSAQGPALFRLSEDPAERKNLAAENPQQVDRMIAEARRQLDDIEARGFQLAGPPLDEPLPDWPKWLPKK